MADVSSGAYTGVPASELVFVDKPLSALISTLEHILPSVAWYEFFVLFATVLSLLGISWTGLRLTSAGNRLSPLYLVVISALLAPAMTLQMTYTTAAGAIGILLIAMIVSVPEQTVNSRFVFLGLVFVLCVFGLSLRTESLYLVIVLSLPLLADSVRRSRLKLRGTLVLGAAFVTHFLIVRIWSSSSWRSFSEYNSLRGQIHGTGKISGIVANQANPEVASMLSDNGWSVRELLLFDSWFFDDRKVYTLDAIRRLLSVAEANAYKTVSSLLEIVWTNWAFSLSLVLITLAMLFLATEHSTFLIINFFWCLMVSVWIAQDRFPDRVWIIILLNYAISAVFITIRHNSDEPARRSLGISGPLIHMFIVTGLVLALWTDYGPVEIKRANETRIAILNQQVEQLDEIDSDGTFLAVGGAIHFEGYQPFHGIPTHTRVAVIGLGWPTFSPHYETRKHRLNLGNELSRSLCHDPNLYVIAAPSVIDLVRSYLEIRYCPTIRYRVLSRDNAGSFVVQFYSI